MTSKEMGVNVTGQDFAGFNVRPDNKLWIFSAKTSNAYEQEKDLPKAYVFGYTWFEARSGAQAALHLSFDTLQGREVENLADTLLEAGNHLVFVSAPGQFQIVKTLHRMSGKEAQAFSLSSDDDEPDSQTSTMQALEERSESIEIISEEEPSVAKKHAAVSLIEREDGKILCVWNRRYNGWSLPGGMVEDGETPAIAQARELTEETGVITHRAVQILSRENSNTSQPGRASVVHLFLVFSWSGAPREMEHGCPIEWKTREDFVAQSPFGKFYTEAFADFQFIFKVKNGQVPCFDPIEEALSYRAKNEINGIHEDIEIEDEIETADEIDSTPSFIMSAEDIENDETNIAGFSGKTNSPFRPTPGLSDALAAMRTMIKQIGTAPNATPQEREFANAAVLASKAENSETESIVAEEITKPSSTTTIELIDKIHKLVTIGKCSGSYDILVAGHGSDALFLEKKNAEKIANEIRQTIYGACATELAAKYMQGCSDANQLQETKLRTEYLQACNDINARVICLSQIVDNQEIDPVVNAYVFNLLISEIKFLMEKRVDADIINDSTANGQEEISAKDSQGH